MLLASGTLFSLCKGNPDLALVAGGNGDNRCTDLAPAAGSDNGDGKNRCTDLALASKYSFSPAGKRDEQCESMCMIAKQVQSVL